MTGGGHLEFSHEKVDEQNGSSFFQSLRVNISEKTQIFNVYMNKSQDVYELHNCVYYIHFTVTVTHCLANIALFSFLSPI